MPRGPRLRPSHSAFAPPVPPPAGACTALASLGHGRVVRPAPSPSRPPFLPLCPREGGPLSAPPFLHPPPLGGRRRVGGGGALMFSLRRSPVTSTRCGIRPSAGGGGVCLVAPVVALSTLRPPSRWSSRRGLHGACPLRARSCGSSRHRCLPTLPRCPRGGGSLVASPLPALPALGGAGMGGGGRCALFVSPPLHARRRQDVGTTQSRGEALGCCGGGGGFRLGLPALLHGLGPAAQDNQPLLPLGGSRHVSAWCSVSRACSLLCPYLLEEVRTRVETEDEEVRAAGRTYRTPRRLLAPSATLVEGRAPVSAPNSPGGPTAHPLPGACVSTSERPDTGAVVSVRWKWRLQSGRALSSPGLLPPPSAMEAPEVLWQRRGETDGGFICGIPWPPS